MESHVHTSATSPAPAPAPTHSPTCLSTHKRTHTLKPTRPHVYPRTSATRLSISCFGWRPFAWVTCNV
eukprot:scaffold117413_cov19-Tisochrysis_lutea.AAC.1